MRPSSATDDLLALTRQWASAAPGLLITANRAAILHVLPTGEDVILLPLDDHYDAAMIRALIDPTHDLDGTMRGPLKRSKAAVTTPSRAAMELVKAALLLPAIVAAPVAADEAWAEARGISVVSVEEIALMAEAGAPPVLDRVVAANVPLEGAEASRIVAFRPGDGGPEHLAIVIGQPTADAPVLVRLHSECLTGDLLGSLKCDCGAQLKGAIHTIAEAGSGVVLYLLQRLDVTYCLGGVDQEVQEDLAEVRLVAVGVGEHERVVLLQPGAVADLVVGHGAHGVEDAVDVHGPRRGSLREKVLRSRTISLTRSAPERASSRAEKISSPSGPRTRWWGWSMSATKPRLARM